MGAYDTANRLGVMGWGRARRWTSQDAHTARPSAASDGVSIIDAVRVALVVNLRRGALRTATVTIETFDAASTYTVDVDGVTYTSATPASASAGLIALAAAINAGVKATATAVDEDGANVATSGLAAVALEIVVTAVAGAAIDFAVSGGTGVMACAADAQSASVRVWQLWAGAATTGSTAPTTWSHRPDLGADIDDAGWSSDRDDWGGRERVAVELYDLAAAGDGADVTLRAQVFVGPAVLE